MLIRGTRAIFEKDGFKRDCIVKTVSPDGFFCLVDIDGVEIGMETKYLKEKTEWQNGVEWLEDKQRQLKIYGVDIDYNFIDINWFQIDQDAMDTLAEMFNFLEQKKIINFYGMHTRATVSLSTEGSEACTFIHRSERTKKVLLEITLNNFRELQTVLLAVFRGIDNIHDYGKYTED